MHLRQAQPLWSSFAKPPDPKTRNDIEGDRGIGVIQRNKALVAVLTFAAAIAAASFCVLGLPVALSAVVVVYAKLRIVPLRRLYEFVK